MEEIHPLNISNLNEEEGEEEVHLQEGEMEADLEVEEEEGIVVVEVEVDSVEGEVHRGAEEGKNGKIDLQRKSLNQSRASLLMDSKHSTFTPFSYLKTLADTG